MSWINVNDCCGCEHCIGCGRNNRKVLVCDECQEEKDQYYTNGEEIVCGDCLKERFINYAFNIDYLIINELVYEEHLFSILKIFNFDLVKFAPNKYSFITNREVFDREDWYEKDEVFDVMKEIAEDFSTDELVKLEEFNNWSKFNY